MHNTDHTAAAAVPNAATCVVEPAGLAHPIAMMSIRAGPESTAAAAAEAGAAATTHLWLNAPAVPAASAPVAPIGGHKLLHAQLSAIRSLQLQLVTLKFQLRQCIDEFAAVAAVPAASAAMQQPTSAGAPPASSSSSHPNLPAIESRLLALRSTYKELHETLTTRIDYTLPRTPLVRDELDVLSSSYFVPVMENSAAGTAKRLVNHDVFRSDHPPTASNPKHRSALAVHRMENRGYSGGDAAATVAGSMQQSHAGAAAMATAAATMNGDEQRPHSARASASDSASSTTAAAASELASLLSSSQRAVSFHSALLLNLVQCSGLNPFSDVQQQLRTNFGGSGGDTGVSASSGGASAGGEATAVAGSPPLAAAASPAVSPAPAPVSSSSLLDSALLFLMEKFYARHMESCRLIDEARRAHTEEARKAHHAAVAAAAAAAAAAATVQPPPPPPQPQPLPPAVYPSLPFLRKIVSTASMASPYAPVPAPVVAAAAAHPGSTTATAAAAAAAAPASLAVEALIVSIPHVLHAYIEFEGSDSEDGDAESAAACEAEFLHSPPSLSDSARAASLFRIHRVSVVGWSELDVLVDSYAESAFACFREVAAQARLGAEIFKHRAARDIRGENIAAVATAVKETQQPLQQQQQPARPELHRTTTPLPASVAASAASASSASAASSPALPAWYRTPQLRALVYFVVRLPCARTHFPLPLSASRCCSPQRCCPRAHAVLCCHAVCSLLACWRCCLFLLCVRACVLGLSPSQSWLSSYSDLFSRPCAECKLHLALHAPSTLAFAHAHPSSDEAGAEAAADVASFHSMPLVSHSMSMMPPCVRLHGLHSSEYTALHAQCMDRFLQTQPAT